MTCHAIIPKNRSASSIAFSLSGGQISFFTLSDFAMLQHSRERIPCFRFTCAMYSGVTFRPVCSLTHA